VTLFSAVSATATAAAAASAAAALGIVHSEEGGQEAGAPQHFTDILCVRF
jgi:hypothetical protein